MMNAHRKIIENQRANESEHRDIFSSQETGAIHKVQKTNLRHKWING
jgi:hypothetical protein